MTKRWILTAEEQRKKKKEPRWPWFLFLLWLLLFFMAILKDPSILGIDHISGMPSTPLENADSDFTTILARFIEKYYEKP